MKQIWALSLIRSESNKAHGRRRVLRQSSRTELRRPCSPPYIPDNRDSPASRDEFFDLRSNSPTTASGSSLFLVRFRSSRSSDSGETVSRLLRVRSWKASGVRSVSSKRALSMIESCLETLVLGREAQVRSVMIGFPPLRRKYCLTQIY